MDKIKCVVLDAATIGDDINISDIFGELGSVEAYSLSSPEEARERLKNADVCITNKVKLNASTLSGADSLKLICVAATGYDNIDTVYCKEHGIAVCNVAGYSTNSVSQLTLAMVLSASVRLSEYRESVVSGRYSAGKSQNILTPVYHELCGKTWGIVGYGAIGKKVAEGARALGCKVVACKRSPDSSVDVLPLSELLAVSDIVSVHVPLTDSTRGMIGEKEFALMKDGAYLVNMARGAVLCEDAAAKAVESGKLGFFGCDVYSVEPMAKDHPYQRIMSRENVCLTPHMAWGAYEARLRCVNEIKENINAFFSGGIRNRIV